MTRSLLLPCALAVLLATPSPARAQVLGYGLGGMTQVSGFYGGLTGFHAAAGAEGLVKGIAGASGEIGILGNSSSALVAYAVNGVAHVMPATRRVSPFVTGGYMHMSSGEGSFEGWNAGAGVDIRSGEHVGVRLEARDHVRPDHRGTVHYFCMRAGITFR